MATLILGAVGTIVGGPLGGALGSLIGNSLDRALIGGKRQQGPRLSDLRVQTSSYGNPIPRLFGRLRVAGTVIWSTDLREDKHSSGGGKAGGKGTSYTYSASFAVALAGRPIQSVGRIWADGNLLRGAAGDWKSDTGFRLYLGGEDQAPDPLIAAAEGMGATPAHRGTAYAVFETMQLADFGNRIPSLTFEVVADAGPVATSDIAVDLGAGALTGSGGAELDGFAANASTIREALQALAQIDPMSLSSDGDGLVIDDAASIVLDSALFGSGPEKAPRLERERQEAGALPDAVALGYFDPARGYQAGLQRARRDGIGRRETSIELPAALTADNARALAERALSRMWTERDTATVHLPWRCLAARAGTGVTLDDGSSWRVSEWTLEKMALTMRLRPLESSSPVLTGADPGRAVASPDMPAGQTLVTLLDLPALDDGLATSPNVLLAAAGTEPGWRRAVVSRSLDGGASWQTAGQTAFPAVIGSAETQLQSGPTLLFDRIAHVDVVLAHNGMALQGADDDMLVAGANLAWLGGELIQFGQARQVGPARWRLSTLLRGRRGTEWSAEHHGAGEPFVLLDPATLLKLDVPLASMGATVAVSALGVAGGGEATEAAQQVIGRALRPPAPAHIQARRAADGTIELGWTRRSRLGWAWLDGNDAPLGEDAERYRLQLRPSVGDQRTVDLEAPYFRYTPAQQAEDGAAAAPALAISLLMLGTTAPSEMPAIATWTW